MASSTSSPAPATSVQKLLARAAALLHADDPVLAAVCRMLADVAQRTHGFSPADLAHLVTTAAGATAAAMAGTRTASAPLGASGASGSATTRACPSSSWQVTNFGRRVQAPGLRRQQHAPRRWIDDRDHDLHRSLR